MPRIDTYDPNVGGLQPTERGTDARVQAARRIGTFYNQAAGAIDSGAEAKASAANDVARSATGVANSVELAALQVEDHLGHEEISKGAAAGAKLFDDLQNQWNSIAKNTDPNDPSVAAKFREEVLEPSLQNFNESYSNTDLGRKWSEQHVESMRNQFYRTTAADMSSRAADAVTMNAKSVITSSSNSAFKNPDFHTVDYLLDRTQSDIAAVISSSPNLKGVAASHVQTTLTENARGEIVKAAAQGAIAKASDPEAVAATFAERYPDYINGADANTLARAAKVQAKANLLQDKQIETYQRQQDDRAVHAGTAKIMADNVASDPATGKIIVKPEYFSQTLDLARKYPNAPSVAATVHSAITWGEHQQTQRATPTVDDPVVKSDLYTRMFDADHPTTLIDLQKANVEGKLSPHSYSAMHQLLTTLEETPLKGEVWKDTLAAAKASLTYTMPNMPGKDPMGQAAYAKFVQTFVPVYLQQSRTGVLQPNALDLKDPKSLISLQMAPFKRTTNQIIQDRIDEMSTIGQGSTTPAAPNAPAARPIMDIPAGMSPADALKKFGPGPVRLPDGRTKVLQDVPLEAVPTAPEREIGKVYDLPKGKFKWNGSGWEKP